VLLEPEFEVFDFYQNPTGELDEPSKGEVHDDLVVLHCLPAFHRTEIPQQAVMAIAHAGKTAVFEVRHSVRMHRREVPSIMATPLPSSTFIRGCTADPRRKPICKNIFAMIAVRFYRTARSFLSAWRLGPSLAWALLCWVVLGSLDQLFESTPVSRQGMNVRVARDYQGLRVGLALSGGGYRAALVHAGVLNILARRGVPVTNLSTVSGGSIIGSLVAAGGNPRDFVQAVAGGRDMLNFQNAARILASTQLPVLHVALWPFETFTTRGLQANLVDRVLLNGVNARGMQIPNAPLIMVCMTDLTYALAVGAMPDGLLLGPTQKRFFKEGEALQLEGLNRLADRVAVSGGFPGVFPALKARATLVTFPWSILGKDRSETLC
jgi:hypothetical protein